MREKGYTILELMIVVALIGALAGYGIPNMFDLVKSNRLVTSTNELITAVHYAKSEASKRARPVFVQAISSTAGNEWGAGWRVWADEDRNGVMAAGELVREFEGGLDVVMDEAASVSSISFNSLGVPRGSATLTINVCDDRSAETGRSITMTALGVIEVDRTYVCS